MAKSGDWLNARRARHYPLIFVTLYFLGALAWVLSSENGITPDGQIIGTDFLCFYTVSELSIEGLPALSYDWPAHAEIQHATSGIEDDTFYPWLYPPQALLYMLPLALVPYGLSLFLWICATLGGYLIVMRKAVGPLVGPGVALTAALGYGGVATNIGHGQTGFLAAALLGGSMLLLKDNRQIAAGLIIALLTYKPQLGVLVPFALIAGGYWRAFFSAGTASLLLAGLSVAVFGLETWHAFIQSTITTREIVLEQFEGNWEKMQTVFSMVRIVHGPIWLAYLFQAIVSLVTIVAVCKIWRCQTSFGIKAAALVIGTTLATPYLLDYDLILMAPGLAWLTADGLKNGFAPWQKTIMAAAWVWPLLARTLAESTYFQFTPILIALVMWIIWQRAHEDDAATGCGPV